MTHRCALCWENTTRKEFYGHYVCKRCRDNGRRYEFPYGYWPDPLKFRDWSNDVDNYGTYEGVHNFSGYPFLGLEIECYRSSPVQGMEKKIIEDTDGWIWPVHDMSCGNGGFEINAHPFTLPWIKNNHHLLNTISALRRYKYAGFNAKRSCGMHVHIGIDQFISELHQYKYLYLFREFPSFLYKVSRRTKGSLRQWANPKVKNNSITSQALTKYKDSWYRGSACYNRKTIEVRLFRSSLRKETILANLELITAAFFYTKLYPIKEISPTGLLDFLEQNIEEYPNAFNMYNKIKEPQRQCA